MFQNSGIILFATVNFLKKIKLEGYLPTYKKFLQIVQICPLIETVCEQGDIQYSYLRRSLQIFFRSHTNKSRKLSFGTNQPNRRKYPWANIFYCSILIGKAWDNFCWNWYKSLPFPAICAIAGLKGMRRRKMSQIISIIANWNLCNYPNPSLSGNHRPSGIFNL